MLHSQGEELHHCVGMYVPYVEREQSFIASVTMPSGERSTIEFDPYGNIKQHYGMYNKRPSDESVALGESLESKIRELVRRPGKGLTRR